MADYLVASQLELLNNGYLSDMTVKCGTKIWNCHRSILLPRCEFFRVVINAGFLEATSKVVTFPEDSEFEIAILLTYLYSGQIDVIEGIEDPMLSCSTATHEVALVIGDKYDVQGLKSIGLTHLLKQIDDLSMDYQKINADQRNKWMLFAVRACKWSFAGAEQIKKGILMALAAHGELAVETKAFQAIIGTNDPFMAKFVMALAHAVTSISMLERTSW